MSVDVMCTMTISDMSYDTPGLRVLIFGDKLDSLPRVKVVGDIIRFHRVTMQNFNGIPQAVANVSKFSAYVLLSGKKDDSYEPYQTSSKGFTFEQHDRNIIDLIRDWIVTHPIGTGGGEYLVQIRRLKEGAFFDLCCKVLYVHNHAPDYAILMYVWDGTDAQPVDDMALHLLEADNAYREDMDPKHLPLSRLSQDVLRSLPSKGTILPVVPDIPSEELRPQLPPLGAWVKFRNLTCRIRHGSYEAVFMRESKISLLGPDSKLVKDCEGNYQQRAFSEEAGLPEWSPKPLECLTVTDYEHVPFSTLREVFCHAQVTQKFRCLVQVVAIWPVKVTDFCAPSSFRQKQMTLEAHSMKDNTAGKVAGYGRDLSQINKPNGYTYRIQLTVEDPTARIQAYLCAEDATRFFNGHPPADLHNNGIVVDALERKAYKLLGLPFNNKAENSSSLRKHSPPWIKCCLKSYYLDKENPWSSRRFRIFGTTLPG
ncbi:hypothetical protein O6H91_08G045300 [Diphasiastrum complanatum]|uniref:Uncharacterized protein n=1 Tax=Diphasiastrum complanatum TaxID=34168 RepID=A0ACC2CXJ2_DIPCM|nr:hypothetical protein O6H91_08G045300 [Diphasiastrum complanatum]